MPQNTWHQFEAPGCVCVTTVLVFGATVGMVLLKSLIVAPLPRAFGLNWADSLHIGLLLGPGGEFGFVIVSVAIAEHMLDPDTARTVLFVTAMTMATISLLSKLNDQLSRRLSSKPPIDPMIMVPDVSDPSPRVLIAGLAASGRLSQRCWRFTRCRMSRSTVIRTAWRVSETTASRCNP